MQGAKKLKQKALDHEHILSSLKQTCRCGQMCMRKMCFSKLKHLRLSYWSQSVLFRRQLLKLYVKRSYIKGKHRYINVDSNCDVCSRAFLYVLRINKNALSNAIKACEKDHENTPGRCPRKVNENTLLTINWLEDYASFYGDRMPNSEDVMLPYKFRKLSVYKSYLADSSVNSQVSKTQFFKIWKNYFPHLKIKQVNKNE